jgi:hypothetical protein
VRSSQKRDRAEAEGGEEEEESDNEMDDHPVVGSEMADLDVDMPASEAGSLRLDLDDDGDDEAAAGDASRRKRIKT